MTKKDSERNKLYSNVKIQKLDPLSDKLSSAGFSGGASKGLKIKDTKKLLKEVKPIIDKMATLLAAKICPLRYFEVCCSIL